MLQETASHLIQRTDNQRCSQRHSGKPSGLRPYLGNLSSSGLGMYQDQHDLPRQSYKEQCKEGEKQVDKMPRL